MLPKQIADLHFFSKSLIAINSSITQSKSGFKSNDFLPNEDFALNDGKYFLSDRGDSSMGRVRTFYGNFLIALRAAVYIKTLGFEGFKKSGLIALLNANYLSKLLEDDFENPVAENSPLCQ